MRAVPHPAKAICAARGIHNTELAEALGVNAHWLGRVLNGVASPSQKLKDAIAGELGLPVDELFDGSESSAKVLDLLRRTRTDRGMALVISDPAVIAKVAGIVAGAEGGDAA